MRSGLRLRAAISVAPAADTALDSPLFWDALTCALVVAFGVTVPVNRWLIGHGKGHPVVRADSSGSAC